MEENLANTYQRLPADTTDAPRHRVTAEQEGQAHDPLPTQTYTGGKTKRGWAIVGEKRRTHMPSRTATKGNICLWGLAT